MVKENDSPIFNALEKHIGFTWMEVRNVYW